MEALVFKSSKRNPVTNSLLVAEKFDKNHKDVIRPIENLVAQNCAAKFFHKTSYDNRGKQYPMFVMKALNNGTKKRKNPYRKSPAVKELEVLAHAAARQKFPEIPPDCLAPRKYRDDNANGLTKCIIDFLKFNGCQAERINNTGRLIDNQKTFTDVVGRTRTIGQKKWIKGTGTNGTADISAVIKGLSVKVEVKHGRDRQSEAQRVYQSQVQHAGGIYIIATTFEQFFSWYNLKFGCYE